MRTRGERSSPSPAPLRAPLPRPGSTPAATRTLAVGLCLALASALPGSAAAGPRSLNGFVLDPTEFEASEILAGGPPRDGIPALDHPPTAPLASAGWADDDLVIGVAWNGQARAYPLRILDWHELVNDTLGGRPILVSYCPLCGTGMVFDRRPAGPGSPPRRFGVSGLLYRSDLLLYDRETESLWSQISATAVTGPARGMRLALVRSRVLRWGRFRAQHPEGTALTRDTGHRRDYGRSPYGDYAVSERLLFPVPRDPRYHPKMPTVGLRVPGGAARAYPAVELARAGGRVQEAFQGRPVSVAYDPEAQVFEVVAPDDLEVVEGYWFAWAAFHPQTSVFTHEESAGPPPPP